MPVSVPLPAADLLQRTALEIERCRALVEKVENAVAHHPVSEWHADFQSIDLLDQMLGDISVLLDTLSRASELDGLVIADAHRLTSPLRLGAVRARLHETPHETGGHHVELF
ncbi:hypothetical protein [Marivita sp.]|uniref:hypothetical protein n=1 Tax=Marivita sp. TaxID=2003365 RepID=UPI0025C1D07C|nr:hypothetical protein [Marivita sp.]